MSLGGQQVFFSNRASTFGGNELGLSTGGNAGTQGDGEQSSHWKADEQSGVHIGIMDPTLSNGTREVITNNDLLAFDTFGYKIDGTMVAPPTPPTPIPPANDNFANAVVLRAPPAPSRATTSTPPPRAESLTLRAAPGAASARSGTSGRPPPPAP